VLRREGFHVLRIAAHEVLRNMDGVLRLISATCTEVGPLHRDASRGGPPTPYGGGFGC
jgi:very-short-patch-repair endonuclease